MNRIQRSTLTIATVATFGAGFVALYRQTDVISTAHRAELRAKQLEILHLDSDLRRTALEARHGLVNQYDSLAATTSKFEAEANRWATDLRQLIGSGDWAMATAVASLRIQVAEQRSDLEHFKSRNAILKNSLRYLPKAALELRKAIQDRPRYAELQRSADAVMFHVFMLSSFREESYSRELGRELAALRVEIDRLRQVASTGDTPVLQGSEIVHVHGTVCRREVQSVEGILTSLGDRSIRGAVTAADRVLSNRINEMESRAAIFRGLLYGFTAVLGLALLFVAGWLRRLYATLENRVTARTAELRTANEAVQQLYDSNRLVLDNVQEGLATIELDGRLSAEMSSAAQTWFGEAPPDATAMDWLRPSDPCYADALDLGLESLRDGFLPRELSLEQLPKRLVRGDRSFDIAFRPINHDDQLQRLLLIAEDVTEQLAQQREEARNRQAVTLAQRLGRDRPGTIEYLRDTEEHLEALSNSSDMIAAQRRLHTLKGNAAIYGLDDFAATCHRVEDALEDERRLPTATEIGELVSAWRALMTEVSPFSGDLHGANAMLQISQEDLAELRSALDHQAPHEELHALVNWWSLEPLATRFARMAEQVGSIARRLGHDEPQVDFDDADLRLDAEAWREFWSATSHVLRNIVDHGIESTSDRQAAHKSPQGRVRFVAHLDEGDGELTFRFSDDGRGVDWGKVQRRAAALGLPHETPDDLQQALFEDRLSTRDQVSETSGRGVGMNAVRSACESIGGAAEIHSEPGKGTELVFRFANEHPIAQRRPVATADDSQS